MDANDKLQLEMEIDRLVGALPQVAKAQVAYYEACIAHGLTEEQSLVASNNFIKTMIRGQDK